ncbi:MAG: NADH-quinone oxidoreductase subunit M [candidate division WOR-3 bacterium]|nr:NADH-quinone oxidoreductase subunit M [candidate division WOR-3 bacterium]MCX7947197.1 NADH-quinone oxidoreductase subunit M [candidate division WOR-3 bacterium]MDW8150253.1 NADH-quinone oxidoreductase subunit M [candidate division WOR-3 bacterium]
MNGILSILIWFPIFSAIPLLFFKNRNFILGYGFVVLLFEFLLSLLPISNFKLDGGFQFIEKYNWIKNFNINYYLGVDGLSFLIIILTTLLSLIGFLSSVNLIRNRENEFAFWYLILTGSLVGVFSSLDLFLFFIFYEFSLIPSYFLILIWGDEERVRASYKFILYTAFSSVLLLVSIIIIYLQFRTFDYIQLLEQIPLLKQQISILLFISFAIAFSVKTPVFPLHGWLPDTYTNAPTSVALIIAGIMAKIGSYGFLRFLIPFFPQLSVDYSSVFIVLSIISIIYGGILAYTQDNLKRLIAYSSFSHMGFITLGIFSLNYYGIAGSSIQILNHGISTGALFLIAGMIYERYKTNSISELSGLVRSIPVLIVFFGIFMLSSVGLPGTNGFIGEFLILLGTSLNNFSYAILAVIGIVISVIYMLPAFQNISYLELKLKKVKDLEIREWFILTPLLILVFSIGIYPNFILNYLKKPSEYMVNIIKKGGDR